MSFYQKLPKPFFVLAPMDDVTDLVFRQIINDLAQPDVYFTEFVNVDGLSSDGRNKLLHKLKYTNLGKPIIAQIWGKEPSNFKKIATEVRNMGFDGIDLNMGCPDKTIVKNGCCSALINNRDLAKNIITSTFEGAKGLPVSVKTRIGFNDIDMSWLDFLLDFELAGLTVHGRTKKQLSKTAADWDVISHVRQLRDQKKVKTFIVGNGDVITRKQGMMLAKKYQIDGIMIGRGVFSDPFVFSENSLWKSYTTTQKIELFIKHIKLFDLTYSENERSVYQLFKFAKLYINGFEGASDLRARIMSVNSSKKAIEILNSSLA